MTLRCRGIDNLNLPSCAGTFYDDLVISWEITMPTTRLADVFSWQQIGANETVSLFIHGYGDGDYAAFMIKPRLASNEPPAAVTVKAQLIEGETHRHVDGTVARTISVHNTSVGPQPFISVHVTELRVFP
jgi:hypothetical protein